MLSKLDHPNIIRHLDSFVEDNMLNIVMEYASGGTVHHMRKSGRLSESHIWKYCIQLLQAVSYIHSQRIVHRDIKTLNVFLDELDNVKLGAAFVSDMALVPGQGMCGPHACIFRRFWHCKSSKRRHKPSAHFGRHTILSCA